MISRFVRNALAISLLAGAFPAAHAADYVLIQNPSRNGGNCTAVLAWLDGAPLAKVCEARGGNQCNLVTTVAEALSSAGSAVTAGLAHPENAAVCLALGGSNCALAQNLYQAVCLGTGGSACLTAPDAGDVEAKREIRSTCDQRSRVWVRTYPGSVTVR